MFETALILAAEEQIKVGGIVVSIIAALVFLFLIVKFGGLWLQARLSGAGVSIAELIGMTLRKVPARMIVINRITAVQAGVAI